MSEDTERMSYEEAVRHLDVDEYTSKQDLHTAYRTASAAGDVDQSILDDAFDVVSDYIKENGVKEKPTSSYSYSSYKPSNIYNTSIDWSLYETEEEKQEKARRATLDQPLPPGAPASYKLVRGIAQHFPYRLGLIGIFALICWWNWVDMSIWTNLIMIGAFFLTVGNTLYPFITRPFRYWLIETIDALFYAKYKREQKAKEEAANTTAMVEMGQSDEDAHYAKYGTNRRVPGDPKE